MNQSIDGFRFFRSYWDAIQEMDEFVQLEVLKAIAAYGLDGTEPKLSSPISRAIFSAIRPNLDSSRESSINGKSGGRPSKKAPFQENEKPPFQNSKTNKNKELEEEKKKKDIGADKPPTPSKFLRPSIEEVKVYCDERHNGIDAEAFIDFYEARGWMVGRNKMKDWRAAVRTWERREKDGKAAAPKLDEGRWGDLKSVKLD